MHETCPHCHQNHFVIKAARNRSGTQRYRCQYCHVYFTPKPKPIGYADEIKRQALQLHLEGTSFRAIGRLLGVHNQTVINWITAAALALPAQVADTTPTDYIEIDELFTFVEAKKNKSMW